MQNPREYTLNPDTGRAELTSIADVFTNPIFLWGYAHVIAVALIFGGAVCSLFLRGTCDAGIMSNCSAAVPSSGCSC